MITKEIKVSFLLAKNSKRNLKTFTFQVLIREIERPNSDNTIRQALNTVIQLGNETSNMSRISEVCNIFAIEGGVRALLRHCDVRNASADVRIMSLRSLGAICCVSECIRQFESVKLTQLSSFGNFIKTFF